MKDDYKDIIDLPYNGVKQHSRMTMYERAAQLSPFAALTGHNDMLDDTARTKEEADRENDMPKDFEEWYAVLTQMTEQQLLDLNDEPSEH
ncbi:MAG: hypothetical protein J6I41_06500 [Bacteroidales bacterium]|jgi:hypothetical protein|nr:hypothetical protein [Bacteroidales bacterium]